MITFEKDSFTIIVKSCSPVEDWQGLMHDLLDLMHNESDEVRGICNHREAINLIKEMQPSWDEARKMAQ